MFHHAQLYNVRKLKKGLNDLKIKVIIGGVEV